MMEGNAGAMLIDQQGNECALVTGPQVPCVMEVHLDRRANWVMCPLRTGDTEAAAALIKNLRESAFVFPREKGGAGVPFAEWMDARVGQEQKPVLAGIATACTSGRGAAQKPMLAGIATACTCGRGAVDENPKCPLHAGGSRG